MQSVAEAKTLSMAGVVVGRAAVIASPRELDVRELEFREPAAAEVRVRIEGCGVCASTLPLWEGKPWFDYPLEPGAPGHEGWGVDVATGRRVALLSNRAYAEYTLVPAALVVPLPPELDGV